MENHTLEINIVFGGGINQLELIHLLKIHNEYVMLIDINENCPGREFSDEFISSQGDECKLIIDKVGERKVKRILTSQNENTLLSIVKLCKHFGIPFYPKEALENITNKSKSKLILQRNGLKVPLSEVVTNGQQPHSLDFPFIIKPLKLHSSIGVRRIDNSITLELYFSEFNRLNEFQVEQIIEGQEFSVEGLVRNKVVSIFQVTKKELFSSDCPVERSHTQTNFSNYPWFDELQECITETCSILGLDDTAFHIEVIRSNRDNIFYPIDIGPRLGGDFISSYLMELSLGKSLTEILLYGEKGNYIESVREVHCKVCYLGSKMKGKVMSIGKTEDLYFVPGLRLLNVLVEVGDIVDEPKSSADRIAVFIISAHSERRLEDLERYLSHILFQRILIHHI